jgi:hypothetical protein
LLERFVTKMKLISFAFFVSLFKFKLNKKIFGNIALKIKRVTLKNQFHLNSKAKSKPIEKASNFRTKNLRAIFSYRRAI